MGMKRLSRLSSLGIPLAGAVLFALSAFANTAVAQEKKSELGATEQKGKDLAFDRQKGNCLACHVLPGGDLPGNLGPSLVGVATRFGAVKNPETEQEKAGNKKAIQKLTAMLQDPEEQVDPTVSMPPFGKHKILSQEEIDKVVAYLMTLKY